MKVHKNLNESLWEIWNEADDLVSNSYEKDLEALHQAMGVGAPKRAHISPVWFYSLAAAASLVLVMMAEYLFINNSVKPVETVTLVASASSKGEFILPDGSHVWLNTSSSLSYDKSNPRHVQLEGEGFFDVAKKDGQKFVVEAGDMSVTVLGTRFNVRNSSHFESTEVSLLSGRVAVESNGCSALLAPGEKVTLENGVLEKTTSDVTFDTAWMDSKLVFENASLSDILNSLEHWYNVNIRVDSTLNLSSRFSLTLSKESFPETQRVLSLLTGCNFKTLDEKNVLISNL